MMGKYKPYEKYKNSGIAWLGEVPEHWEVRRLKYAVSINDESLLETTNGEFTFDYIDIESVQEGKIIKRTPLKFKDSPSRARRVVKNGDVIVSTVRTYLKAIVQIENTFNDLIVSTGFAVLRPGKLIDIRFLNYCARANTFIDEIVANSKGVSYPAITSSELSNIPILLPSPEEQTAIARFLDYKLSKINRFIRKKKQLIKLLNEQKAAIINQAVTKGLDPNADMKNSGIEWLGEIPAHWEVRKLKGILEGNREALKPGPFGSDLKNQDIISNGYKVYTQRAVLDEDFEPSEYSISATKFKELATFEVQQGDILLTTRGTIGRCCIVPAKFHNGVIHPCIIRLRINRRMVFDQFVKLFIERSNAFQVALKYNSNATTIDVIYGNVLRDVFFVLPPTIIEQQQIVAHIETETALLTTAISTIEKELTLVEEYKTALIAEAVTGKIDVRGYVVPETDMEADRYEEIEEAFSLAAEDDAEYQNEETE